MDKDPRAEVTRRRDDRIHSLFGRAGLGITIVDPEGRWLEANPAFCAMVGYDRDELLNSNFQDITHPDDLARNLHLFRSLIDDQIKEYSLRKRFFHRDGRVIWADITVTLVRPRTEEPYLIAIVRDARADEGEQRELRDLVSERTSQMRKIRRERDTFFELTPEVFAIIDPDDARPCFRRVNPALRRMLEYTDVELLSAPLLSFVHPDDHERTVARLRARAPERSFENRYLSRSGEAHWISWRSHVGPNGLFYCVGRDVTEEKEWARREAAQREHLEATSKLNTLGRMAANISHEIKNPLTVVYGNACRLRLALPDVPESCRRMLSDIESMSMRIVKIVDGLRGFTREGARDPRETVALARILDDTLSFCHARFSMTGVEFECAPADPGVRLTCQPVQIQQVILNLLNNAFDALETSHAEPRRIGIRHQATETTVSITVYDNGPGVEPGLRPRVFDPFFTTKQVGKGTGLGLNIARSILESHGGRIYLDESARDTAFTVELPRTRD